MRSQPRPGTTPRHPAQALGSGTTPRHHAQAPGTTPRHWGQAPRPGTRLRHHAQAWGSALAVKHEHGGQAWKQKHSAAVDILDILDIDTTGQPLHLDAYQPL